MSPSPSLTLADFLLVLPAVTLFVFSLLPLAIKVFINKNTEVQTGTNLAIALLGLFSALALLIIFQGSTFSGVTYLAFAKALVFDRASMVGNLIILILSIFSLPFFTHHPSINKAQFSELIFLYLNSILGMMFLVWSNDLIMTFIGLEMMSLCLYMLVCMNLEQKLSKEAAVKYFVLGSLASGILLYGISLIYGSVIILTDGQVVTHYSDIQEIAAELVTKDRIFLLGYILVLVGFAFKVAVFPFHNWAPDVYQGASTPLTIFMSTAVKAASFAAFLRFVSLDAIAQSNSLLWVVQWVAVLTMLIGNFGALVQSSIKRMLAYSSVAHSGYIFSGVIAACFATQPYNAAIQSVYVYLLAYGLFSIGTFGFLSFLEKKLGEDINFDALKGLFYKSPYAALGLALCFLGLAGIPPTLGFFSKLLLFSTVTTTGLYWLLLWGLINSVIGVYYYLRPIVYMFFYAPEESSTFDFSLVGGIQQKLFFVVSVLSLIGGFFLPALI